jgi:probable HAF family extracellular repeat protein
MQPPPIDYSTRSKRALTDSRRTVHVLLAYRAHTSVRIAHCPQACRVQGVDVKVGSGTHRTRFAAARLKLRCAVIAAWVIVLGGFGVKSVQAQCMYEITAEISTPGCPPFELAPITATAMNDHGVVVGSFIGCNLDNDLPFMWSKETGFVAIPLPPGVPSAEPMDVNNSNEIVGSLVRPELGEIHAFHWKDGVWTELPLLPGFPIARAYAINDGSLIVGEAFDPNSSEPFRAVRWNRSAITELQLPIGPNAYARDINAHSSIVGLMGEALTATSSGFLQQDGGTIEIPPVAGTTSSEAGSVNLHDIVTGVARPQFMGGPVPTRSWVFEGQEPVDLGSFSDNIRTRALAINAATQIVGYSSTGTESNKIPFLWQNGVLDDLRTLVVDRADDLFLREASAVNAWGHIIVSDPAVSRWLMLEPSNRPFGDANIDCVVDELDVLAVLADWGPQGGKDGHPTDLVTNATFQPPGDARVDAADLAVVLGNWSASSSRSKPTRK